MIIAAQATTSEQLAAALLAMETYRGLGDDLPETPVALRVDGTTALKSPVTLDTGVTLNSGTPLMTQLAGVTASAIPLSPGSKPRL